MAKLLPLAPTAFALHGLLGALMDQFKDDEPLQAVLDPTLSIQSSLTEIAAVRNGHGLPAWPTDPKAPKQTFPLLGFNYSQLSEVSPLGKRAINRFAVRSKSNNNEMINYYLVEGQFDFSYIFLHKDPKKLDLYEAAHVARARFTNLVQFDVPFVDQQNFPFLRYFIDWGTIDTKDHQKDPVEYHAFTGVARVRGIFAVLEETPALLVNKLILDLRNWSAQEIYTRWTKDLTGHVEETDGPKIPAAEYDRPAPGIFPED